MVTRKAVPLVLASSRITTEDLGTMPSARVLVAWASSKAAGSREPVIQSRRYFIVSIH
ncbi:hypothetical protein D3C80_1442310 [compost metagenome]